MLAAGSAIPHAGENVEVVVEQESDPLVPCHGVGITGTNPTPFGVDIGNESRERRQAQ